MLCFTAIPKDELEAALSLVRGGGVGGLHHHCCPSTAVGAAATGAYNHIQPEVVKKETDPTGEGIQYTRYVYVLFTQGAPVGTCVQLIDLSPGFNYHRH